MATTASELVSEFAAMKAAKVVSDAAAALVGPAYAARDAARVIVDASVASGGVSEETLTAQVQTLIDAFAHAIAVDTDASVATSAYQQARNAIEQDLYSIAAAISAP